MDQVVPVLPHHAQALGEHENIAENLLQAESRANVADAEGARDAIDAAVGDVDVLTLVQGEQVHLMASRAQKLEHSADRQRSSSRLEEWMGREHEYPHPAASITAPG